MSQYATPEASSPRKRSNASVQSPIVWDTNDGGSAASDDGREFLRAGTNDEAFGKLDGKDSTVKGARS